MSMVSSVTLGDPASLLNAQLASALSTMGDAQYWEENISPTTIRTSLASSDPSNPSSTPALLKGMKWLLASISKGRDVSDFYPHVVKLVGASSLEVRKMVYMFLVQYADHDATTRELSLLSINSFQRGLADSEQLIRALALRVLTSIRIQDILQIQMLGVQKCAKDNSPYVRKCAANALAKLSPRCDEGQYEMLLEIMKSLLDQDSSTMVLTSCLVAFAELCPNRLDLLHTSFRKICHLLTDMDEWGQVVVIDTLARYCRRFFREPKAWKQGTAERIDRERRVRRTLSGIANESNNTAASAASASASDGLDLIVKSQQNTNNNHNAEGSRRKVVPKKVKRRVVKKGFYSDEEDESTEEELYENGPLGQQSSSIAGVMRQRNIMGFSGSSDMPAPHVNEAADEDEELNEDHRLLLRSSMPLLKSRNAGVVLSVCSLQYYCGVSSIKVRSSIGKALVRIHRDRREIQYVVLTSIRTLVHECPSAFAPFLQDFFVMAMDPSFTRLIKLEILTALALEPASIEAVLTEMRTYIRHGDSTFACAAIRAVGTVVELARIVHNRHGVKTDERGKERRHANRIALNCLHGLAILSRVSENSAVVGECVIVMQRILLLLGCGTATFSVEDPNDVQDFALQRILLLLVNALTNRAEEVEDKDSNFEDDDETKRKQRNLKKVAGVDLPSPALASALWIIGEWVAPLDGHGVFNGSLRIKNVEERSFFKIRFEICRLLAKSFVSLDPSDKMQAVHFASKVLVSRRINSGSSPKEVALCESVLSMGRMDVDPDVRDRARNESNLIHLAVGLQYDQEGMEPLPDGNMAQKPTLDNIKRVFLNFKPAASSLPLEDVHYKNRAAMGESGGDFRFGTLSSLVGHRARNAYLPLPPWSPEDSPSSLRDPVKREAQISGVSRSDAGKKSESGFYENSDSDDESSSSGDSDSDSDSSNDSSSSDSGDSSYDGDEGSSSSDAAAGQNNNLLPMIPSQPFASQSLIPGMSQQTIPNGGMLHPELAKHTHSIMSSDYSSESDSDSGSDSSSDDEDSDDEAPAPNNSGGVGSLIPMGGQMQQVTNAGNQRTNGSVSSVADDFKGIVLEPVVVDANDSGEPNMEKDSSAWFHLVRVASASGGLAVKARYLRGKTKAREVQLIGLIAEKPTTVCVQVCFENKRTDGGVIRRIRILQRASVSSSSSHVAPKRVVVPGEIAGLRQGQMSSVMVGIDFASPSDRDDSFLARFDIKYNGGTIPVELRPSLAEILQSCDRTRNAFDAGMSKLQGFNRVESVYHADDKSFLTVHWVQKHANLTPVKEAGKAANLKEGMGFVGCLPASGDPVFVLITCADGGDGKITVCCEHALAVNGIVNTLKKAIAEASQK